MVIMVEKKLIRLANTFAITIPKDFIEKFGLKKGDVVNMIIMEKPLVIVAPNTDFNSDEIKADLDAAQELFNKKEFDWTQKLSQKAQHPHVRIEEKKLIQLSNTLVVTVPNKDFVEKSHIKKGDFVKTIIMNKAFMVIDRNTDFNSDKIKAELDEAQRQCEEKEKRDQFAWIDRLSIREQNEIKEPFLALLKEIEEWEAKTGQKWDMSFPPWDLQPAGQVLSKKELVLRHLAEQKQLFEAHKKIQQVIQNQDRHLAEQTEEERKSKQKITKKIIEDLEKSKGTKK